MAAGGDLILGNGGAGIGHLYYVGGRPEHDLPVVATTTPPPMSTTAAPGVLPGPRYRQRLAFPPDQGMFAPVGASVLAIQHDWQQRYLCTKTGGRGVVLRGL